MDKLPGGALMSNGMKNQTSSADRWWGKSIIWHKDGDLDTAYMTRYWIGRLRLHIFHRGDQDPDHHDHPWPFWTFPLTSYVEEVVLYSSLEALYDMQRMHQVEGLSADQINAAIENGRSVGRVTDRQVVPAFRLSHRPATHCHRVLGRFNATSAKKGWTQTGWKPGKIITLVWRGKVERKWGFLKNRDGRWCWTPWKEYVFGNGKSAPCE